MPRIGREQAPPTPVWRSGFVGIDSLLSADTGVHRGAIVLVSGRAGSGKSVLLTQILAGIARYHRVPVLYASAEEGRAQVIRRGRRLGLGWWDNVAFLALDHGAADLSNVLAKAETVGARVIVADSVQAMRVHPDGRPGSTVEVVAVTEALVAWGKARDAVVFVVCHQTKAGGAAGPETIIHLVDTETYYQGEPVQQERVFAVGKNRDGPPGQIVLEMTAAGLVERPDLDAMVVLAEARRIAQGRGREEDDEEKPRRRKPPKEAAEPPRLRLVGGRAARS